MKQIYLSKNGQQQGPFPEDQIVAGLQSGQYPSDTLCWHEGLAEWTPLSNVIVVPDLPKLCSLCGGHGQVFFQQGFHKVQKACPRCNGTGGRPISQLSTLPVFFIMHDGQQQGPLSEVDIRERLQNGSLSSQDFAWKEGMTEWKPLASVMPPITSNPSSSDFLTSFLAISERIFSSLLASTKTISSKLIGKMKANSMSSSDFLTIAKRMFSSVIASTKTISSELTWKMKVGAILAGVLSVWAMIHFNGSSSPSEGSGTPMGFKERTSGPAISKGNPNTPLENYAELTHQKTFLYYFALSGAQMSNQDFSSYVENHMSNRENRPSQQDSFAWQAFLDSMQPQFNIQLEQAKQNRYIKLNVNRSCPQKYNFDLKGFPFLGDLESYELHTGTNVVWMKGIIVNQERFSVLRVPEDQARSLSQFLGEGCSSVDIYAYVAGAGQHGPYPALFLEPLQFHFKPYQDNGKTFIYRPR